jgi:hypothetical protein
MRLPCFFLNATSPQTIKLMRTAMVDGVLPSAWPMRCAASRARSVRRLPPLAGAGYQEQYPLHQQKMPGGLPKKTARALLDIEDRDYVPIIRNPKTTTAETEAGLWPSRAVVLSGCSAGRFCHPCSGSAGANSAAPG